MAVARSLFVSTDLSAASLNLASVIGIATCAGLKMNPSVSALVSLPRNSGLLGAGGQKHGIGLLLAPTQLPTWIVSRPAPAVTPKDLGMTAWLTVVWRGWMVAAEAEEARRARRETGCIVKKEWSGLRIKGVWLYVGMYKGPALDNRRQKWKKEGRYWKAC